MPENWINVEREDAGQPVFLMVDIQYREPASRGVLGAMILVEAHPSRPGFDERSTNEINQREDWLDRRLAKRAVLTARVRTPSRVTWCWRAERVDGLEPILAECVKLVSPWKASARVEPDADWSKWSAMFLPAPAEERYAQDMRVVAALQQHGDPLTPARNFRHYVHFDAEPGARALAGDVRSAGLSRASVSVERSDARWLALVSHESAADPRSAHASAEAVRALAARYGGEYDGWEAALVRSR